MNKHGNRWKERTEYNCKYCNGVFLALPSHNQKYCSRKCLHSWRSENIVGKNHPGWKENPTNYSWKHRRMEKLITKPDVCNKCKIAKPVDLANISGKYLMDFTDWEYLCRKCHMESDGRNNMLRAYGYATKGQVPWNKGLKFK